MFQAEHWKREVQWKSQRATKKSKSEEPAVRQTVGIPSETRSSEVICTVIENAADKSDQTDQLKKQLEAKSQECSNLKRQLEISRKSREDNVEALRKQTPVNEDIIELRSFHQRLVHQCFRLICQRPKSFHQHLTGQFANG